MKTYLNPEISVVNMDSCDVIATSGVLEGGIQVNSENLDASSVKWADMIRNR